MPAKKPKDLLLAEVAYNTFYEEQPQVFFDDLNHDYQMRWVRAIRSVVADYRRLKAPANSGPTPQEAKRIIDKERKQRERDAKKGPKGANGAHAPSEERLAEWEEKDKEDLAKFTDDNWTNKTKAEIQARQRLHYRNKQRAKYGLAAVEHARLS